MSIFHCGLNTIILIVYFLFSQPLCWQLYLLSTHNPLQICNEKLSHLCRYDIMLSCWSHDPLKRPSFRKLVERTELLLSENTKNVRKYTINNFWVFFFWYIWWLYYKTELLTIDVSLSFFLLLTFKESRLWIWRSISECCVADSSTLFLRFTWDWATTLLIQNRGHHHVDWAQFAVRQLPPSLYCKAQLTSFWTTSDTCKDAHTLTHAHTSISLWGHTFT